MGVKPIPEGYHTVTPYLAVPEVDQLIDFIQAVFPADVTERLARPDGTVYHAEVRIGDSVLMMGEPDEDTQRTPGTLYVYVDDTDATYQRALDAGATSVMEPTDMFYGDRNAGVRDEFGNQWWIATHVEDVPPEEMQKRAEAAAQQRG